MLSAHRMVGERHARYTLEQLHYLLNRIAATEVHLISSETKESHSGHTDSTSEQYACRIGSKPHTFEFHETVNHLKGGRDRGTTMPQLITEHEFSRLTIEKKRLDTPETLRVVAEITRLRKERQNMAPMCPKCNVLMQEKSGTRGTFWGCPMFHSKRCKETTNQSARHKTVVNRLSKLRAL